MADENSTMMHEDDIDQQNTTTDGADLTFGNFESEFVRSIMEHKSMGELPQQRQQQGYGASVRGSVKDDDQESDTTSLDPSDDCDGFTSVTKGKKPPPVTFYKTPEGYGKEALRVIHEGDFLLAISYLTRGINLDHTDHRHYINRSYCYLRVGQYSLALNDIRFAIRHLSDIHDLSRAKCREGQALAGLEDYEAAEMAFKESINLAPDFLFAKRQLKRTQIMRIVELGFNERDALLALQRHPETMDAIDQLSEDSLTNPNIYNRRGSLSDDDDDDDELFMSDNENDPSNESILSKLLNYHKNLPEEPNFVRPPPINEKAQNYGQALQAIAHERPLRIKKALPQASAKSKIAGRGVNEMAIWVGNLKTSMTEAMVKKTFTRFGRVTTVKWVLPNEWGFVNFASSLSTQKALEHNNDIEINGIKVYVKPATLQVSK